jgi:hypothetical protein
VLEVAETLYSINPSEEEKPRSRKLLEKPTSFIFSNTRNNFRFGI